MNQLPGLIEGRVVHYVISGDENSQNPNLGNCRGMHSPAIVTRAMEQHGAGVVNLIVLQDDGMNLTCDVIRVVSAPYSEGKEPGTWHWIERADAKPEGEAAA